MTRLAVLLAAFVLVGGPLHPSEADPPDAETAIPTATAPAAAAPDVDLDDLEVDPSEPDFTVINTPTTLRLPRHKWAFRLTHRFSRPLGQGDFGDLLEDLFGFDSAAGVGFEIRFAPAAGAQLGVYRTSQRTIELFFAQNLVRSAKGPLGATLFGSVEGLDNFSEEHSPAVGIVVSRRLRDRGALYLFPAWIGNARPGSGEGDDSTFLLGLGARLRLASTLSVVAEFAPRLAGFKGANPADLGERAAHHLTFGIEKRVGGHSFQLNFSNGFATTPAQLARGAGTGDDWFIGFNLSRKFF